MKRFTREQMAARVARDIPNGAYVNLGIGLPTMVANHLPKDREIILHTENGLLGMGPAPEPGAEDCRPHQRRQAAGDGAAGCVVLPSRRLLRMMRGGHLDCCVLGAFQVSVSGRPRQLAHGREGRDPRGWRRDGPRDRRQERVRDDGTPDQERREQDRGRVHLSRHRPRLRQPHLHRPRRDRRRRRRDSSSSTSCPGLSFDELARLTGVPLRDGVAARTLPERECTMSEAFICDAIRTPFGRYGGALCDRAPRRSGGDADESADGAQRRRRLERASTTSSTAAPTRPARTTATSRAWRCCSRACRRKSRAPRSTACAARASTRSASPRAPSRAARRR